MLKVFSVYDVKAESYGTPMFVTHRGLAMRGFEDAVLDPRSYISKHPSDYSLYELGSWDPNSGKVDFHDRALFVLSAISVVNRSIGGASSVKALLDEGEKLEEVLK